MKKKVTNEDLGWDPPVKIIVILVVTGIQGGGVSPK